ncbi:hypothetical protein DERF_012466 [Dermatophagoides farinae]|uniref:Uncharacterized protein n=1 Tax=Dermatophagoides farinae TaxID=6954 RepID=A0A922L074_DERFA|nr:hypothetical protein DERF_012466 [Dermatophagoides farinae]
MDHILNFITSYFVLGTEAEQVEELNQKCQELTRRIDYLTNSHGINANNIIKIGKNRIAVHSSDLASSMMPNDDIKGIWYLCKTIC